MEEKEQEALRRKEDKDYGFPFVEVKPLAAAEPSRPVAVPKLSQESNDLGPDAETNVDDSFSDSGFAEKKARTKRNQTPLLITLVLLLVLILTAMAYFLYFPSGEKPTLRQTITQPQEVIADAESKEPEVSTDTVDLKVKAQELQIPEPENVAEPPLSTQSTPTPSGQVGKLHLIESKGESAVYHLIVASLPNERVARAEAQVLLDQGKDIWMIFPTGDTRNYRLSVGTFGSFSSASEALPQAKIAFGESTWILKH